MSARKNPFKNKHLQHGLKDAAEEWVGLAAPKRPSTPRELITFERFALPVQSREGALNAFASASAACASSAVSSPTATNSAPAAR